MRPLPIEEKTAHFQWRLFIPSTSALLHAHYLTHLIWHGLAFERLTEPPRIEDTNQRLANRGWDWLEDGLSRGGKSL